jgi:hypothetical protein
MGVQVVRSDPGLGYWATCNCQSFKFAHHDEVSAEQLTARWQAGYKLMVVGVAGGAPGLLDYRIGAGTPDDVLKIGRLLAAGNRIQPVHEVTISQGVGNLGPNPICKHVLCAYAHLLRAKHRFFVYAFSPPGAVEQKGKAPFQYMSVDGWLQAVGFGEVH